MKKSLLATGLIVSASFAVNAAVPGVSIITDNYAADFFTDTAQVWTPSERGIYWFDGDVDGMYTLTRNADDEVMEVATAIDVVAACATDAAQCVYNPFGFVFGNDSVSDDPFSIDISSAGSSLVTLVVENPTTERLRITSQIKDAAGNQAEIMWEDSNAVAATDYYEWNTWRWSKFQATIEPGDTDTIVFDMNKAYQALAWTCTYPGNCPEVGDAFDFSQVTTVLFIVNGGAGSPNEFYDNAPKDEISGFNGTFNVHSMTIGMPGIGSSVNELSTSVASMSVSPNPAANAAKFAYEITENTDVQLAVYDALGRQVDVLVDANQAAGQYNVNYDVTNRNEGVYFYILRTGNETMTKKLIVSKK